MCVNLSLLLGMHYAVHVQHIHDCSFHVESERVLSSLNGSFEPLVENVQQHRQTVDAERRSLQEAAAALRSMLGLTGTRDVRFPLLSLPNAIQMIQ